MARGGYRPGAGRPKGTGSKDSAALRIAPAADIVRAALKSGMSPLEYMLSVMRDDSADKVRRDRMACAAAPFCHARVSDQRIGKREIQGVEAAAVLADSQSEWSDDLRAN